MASESEFYEQIGRVTELAQYLELDLGHVILITEAIDQKLYEAPKENTEAYIKLRDDIDMRTLGRTLKKVKTILSLSDEIDGVVNEALNARNRFTHHIFREYGLKIHTAEGRAEMLKDIESMRILMRNAYDFSSRITDQLNLKHQALVTRYS